MLMVVLYHSNRVVIHCNKVSIHKLLDSFDNDLENKFENNAWNLEHKAGKLQKN